MTRGILLTLLTGMVLAQPKVPEPTLIREVRGPKGTNDANSIYATLDSVVFSRDGKLMAAGAGTHSVVWDVASGKELLKFQLPEKQFLHRMAFAPDGKSIVWNGREDPQVRVFDTTTGKQIREFPQPRGQNTEAFSSLFLCYSPDGKYMAFNGKTFFEGLDILEVETGKVTAIEKVSGVRAAAFSADGRLLVSHGGEGGVHLWDVKTGRAFRELQAEGKETGGAYKFVSFSPDGQFVATCGHGRPAIDVWSVRSRRRVCSVPNRGCFHYATFSPDGESLLCTASSGTVTLYNLIAEKVIHQFNPPENQGMFNTWLPDGKRVAIIGEATMRDLRQYSIFLYTIPPESLNPVAAQIDDAPPETLWPELSGENELRRRRVMRALIKAPKPTLALIAEKVPPVGKDEAVRVEQLLLQLDNAQAKREEATKELISLGHRFEPLLRNRAEAAAPGEVRNRLRFALGEIDKAAPPKGLLAELRGIEILETLATAGAKALLGKLAGGATMARVSVEARAALDRLGKP